MSSRQRKARDKMTADRWLFNMHNKLRVWFRENGYIVPGNVDFHCGFTRSKNAAATFYHTGAGEPPRLLARLTDREVIDKRTPFLIFVDPSVAESYEAAECLVHEMIHLVLAKEFDPNHHGPLFEEACRKLGLVVWYKKGNNAITDIDDDPTRHVWYNHPRRGAATLPNNDPPQLSLKGVELRRRLTSFIQDLGPYPHTVAMRKPPRAPRTAATRGKAVQFVCRSCRDVITKGASSVRINPEPECTTKGCDNYHGPMEPRFKEV